MSKDKFCNKDKESSGVTEKTNVIFCDVDSVLKIGECCQQCQAGGVMTRFSTCGHVCICVWCASSMKCCPTCGLEHWGYSPVY